MDDCFLIVVFDDASAVPVSHILFDIGAEYAPATLSCPAFELDQVATEADIRRIIPQLPGCTDSFAVLGFRDGTYMQVETDGRGFHLEHQLVTTAAHYRCAEAVSADQAVAAFLSYGFGHYEWARTYRWERMDL
ncbi:MAG: hypothetical protein EOO27_44770 [Comamonadaceae bacterium]|nr:MAG: hypothetical protein EOO27_44770 [Comamonadaceae bacterium]